jgi:hypothetical protein
MAAPRIEQETTEHFSVRVPVSIVDRLEREAKENDRNFNAQVVNTLRNGLGMNNNGQHNQRDGR